jgi:hypothetical protein
VTTYALKIVGRAITIKYRVSNKENNIRTDINNETKKIKSFTLQGIEKKYYFGYTNIIFANCTGQGIADRKTAKEKFLYLSKKAKLMEKNENVKKELGMH